MWSCIEDGSVGKRMHEIFYILRLVAGNRNKPMQIAVRSPCLGRSVCRHSRVATHVTAFVKPHPAVTDQLLTHAFSCPQ